MQPAYQPHSGQNVDAPTLGDGADARTHASLVPPSPFSLEAGKDDDVALFQDARTGFSHLLPGRPSLALARPGAPPADATIHLQDAPLTLRYKLEPPSVHASSAAELARLTALRFASWRAQTPVTVEFANPTWLLSWGAEGAAVATYDVGPPPEAAPSPREDLFVLVRQGMTYLVTWTYPRGFTDDPAYASFASVAEATMIWDPMRWEQRGRVWPDSTFAFPGIYAAPKPRHNETARALSRVSFADDERTHILLVLAGIVSNAGAPWVELRPDILDTNRHAIVSAFRDPELRAFIESAFAGVQTAHDLRGLAVLLGRALDVLPSAQTSTRPSSPLPPHRTDFMRG